MRHFSTAEELTNLQKILGGLPLETILIALAMLAVSILLVRVTVLLVDRVMKRTRLDASLYRFIKTLLRIVLYFIAILIIASYLGIDVTSLVALLSVVSLAISLSVQSALSNVAGGMMVMGTKPFKRGDYVSVDGLEGTIDEIGMVYTKLHTIDNRSVLIPNAKVSSVTIENFSTLGKRRLELDVSASYDSPPERVMDALRKAVNRCEPMTGEEIRIGFQSFGDSAITYRVHFWVPASRYIQTGFEFRRAVWEEFQNNAVEMTYPHLNVHLKNE